MKMTDLADSLELPDIRAAEHAWDLARARVRRRHTTRISAAAAAAAGVAAVASIGLLTTGPEAKDRAGTSPSTQATTFENVRFELPEGWRLAPDPIEDVGCLVLPDHDSSDCVATVSVADDPASSMTEGAHPVETLTGICNEPGRATVSVTHSSVSGRAASHYTIRCAEGERIEGWALDNRALLISTLDTTRSSDIERIFASAEVPPEWPEPSLPGPSVIPTETPNAQQPPSMQDSINIGRVVTGEATGPSTVTLDAPPANATWVKIELTCLTAGTLGWPDGSSATCSASDLPSKAFQLVSISTDSTDYTLEASDGMKWSYAINYVGPK